MPKSQAERANKIDAMMDQASRALVSRDYFGAEKLALSALRRAHHDADYERMARIILPLQEARRQKREMAFDTKRVFVVDGEIPHGRGLVSGCYLVTPPRVGADGRMLRDAADEKRAPVFVLVREPPTRDGLWPIVAVGPVTVRAKVGPFVAPPPPAPKASAKGKARGEKGAPAASAAGVPSVRWFVAAGEALGDEAIGQVCVTLPAAVRVSALMDRLESVPHHEKLHQRLEEACREALLEPRRKRKPGQPEFAGDEFDLADDPDDDIV
ncbi:MAG TPA: hypothetical protein PKE29_17580 [Phycisphaerales bacterium]|nr:hypothetical protein [Phycisphaerales bacterium]